MKLTEFKDAKSRRDYISKTLSLDLTNIGNTPVNEEKAKCENLIGAIGVPLGVGGPININGKKKFESYVPLATTEGALVASVSRGLKVLNLSGGANVEVEVVGATRGSVFETSGIFESGKLVSYIHSHFDELSDSAESTSAHLILKDCFSQVVGNLVYIRFVYDTDEAMGMNMVTIATDNVCKFIEKNTKAKLVAVASNYDVDKKPAYLNSILGRGRKIYADCVIKNDVVQKYLKVSVSEVVKTVNIKCLTGSAVSGSMGFNAHFANIVCAFFIATGQDVAHVVEGSLGITTASVTANNDLYFSVTMPDIMIGMVGGGTGLDSQKEAISICKVKNTNELAMVLGAAVLAGELSLIASITEKTLGVVHKRLGR